MGLQNTPLQRGEYDTSSDNTRWGGRVFYFDDVALTGAFNATAAKRSEHIVECCLVKNDSGAALLPKRLVVWKTSGSKTLVDGYSATTACQVAGVVDEHLPAAGVPNGSWFWMVRKGPALATTDLAGGANNVIALNAYLVALTAATSGATTAGRVNTQSLAGATAVLGDQVQNAFGQALSAMTTGQTNADVLVYMDCRF